MRGTKRQREEKARQRGGEKKEHLGCVIYGYGSPTGRAIIIYCKHLLIRIKTDK